MKRILALAMCLALMLTSVVIVSAAADATITVDIIDGPISAGEEVAISVNITEWANAYAVIELVLDYDESLLELDIIEASETGFSGSMAATSGKKFSILCNPSSDRQAKKLLGGEICVAYFFAATDITESTLVSVTANVKGYAQGKADGWVSTQALNVEIENGGVKVNNVWPPVSDDVHECTPGGDIQYDETNHWYNCSEVGCGNLVDVAPHEGGSATCSSKAVCTVCGASYGALATNVHKNTKTINAKAADCGNNGYTGDTFCNDCQKTIAYGQVIPSTGAHGGGEATCSSKAVCSACGVEYGSYALNVHKNTTTTGAKPADCGNAGYTGDTVCNDCNKTVTYGQVIPSTGTHAGGEATCVSKAICTGCNKEYGSVDSTNHKNTVTQNATAADCGNNGYTGNTYCNDCKKTVAYGEAIPATGAHTGGTATCCTKAICTVCSQTYGEFDAENHVGGTKIVNKSATYTGDKQCNSCGVIIEYGEEIIPDGENPGFIVISNAVGKQGDEVTVTVALGENTTLAAYSAVLEFDETALQLVKMTKGDFCMSVNKTTKKANGFEAEDVTEGTLFSATFKILADKGNFEVGVNFTKAVMADTTPVTMNVTKGIITTECEHEELSEIKYDEFNHWYECLIGCGNLVNVAPHEGGEATCSAKAVCTVCGAEYGAFANDVHKNTETINAATADCGNDGYTGDTFCNDCQKIIAYGDVIPATGAHVGGEATCSAKAVCDVCSQEYGEFAADVHKNTEVKNAFDADCGNDGYTGDTFCNDCQKVVETGSVIPATGAHVGGEATCSAKAVCDVCSQEYGELATDVHKNTTVINAKDEDCGNDGYTGDTFCNDCQTVIATGESIPATGAHVGGTATCCAKAVCDVCSQEYGNVDANNHVGGTEIRDAVEGNCGVAGYTGDTYCLGCDTMIDEGETIPATGAHTGGEATCIAKAICTVCGQKYGSFDLNNHKNTELRDYNAGNCGVAGYTGDTFCLDCGRMTEEGSVIPATGNHIGGEATCIAKAVCDVCGQKYGAVDATNHKDTEVINAKDADCGNDGYTGDTFCNDCQKVIEEGDVIPATGNHAGGEATCCAKAVCSVCGQEYGELNSALHDGGTEVRDYVAADCGNDGYTGDTYCLGCDAKIADGETIPATGAHVGGEATCISKAVCTVCGQEYGEIDATNHKDTKVIDAKDADCGNDGYTGDIFCNDCQTVVENGQVIPATGAHVGGEATCCVKAVCDVCGNEYGKFDATNHKNTEVRNVSVVYSGDTYCLDCGAFVAAGEQIAFYGDADNDGEVNTIDAMLIAQYEAGYEVEVNRELADVDGDGKVTIIDAMLIARFEVGLIEKFPVEQ